MKNTDYDFYVRAICSATDTSDWEGPLSFTTLESCFAPSGLAATNVIKDGAELEWIDNNSPIAPEWEVEYGLSGFALGTGTSTVATSDSLLVTGLASDTDYDFYVRSICAVGDSSSWSLVSSFKTLVSCFAPTSLNVPSVTDNSADLDWTDSNGATEWEVEYGLSGFSLGTGTKVGTTSNPPFTVNGLTDDTDYEWYVRAVCAIGDTSAWSAVSSFKTDTVVITCFAPSNLDTNVVAPSSISMRWTDNNTPLASEWEIQYGLSGFVLGSGTSVIATSSANTTIGGLQVNTTYDIYVRAICAVGDTSGWSVVATYTTDQLQVLCLAPSNLSATNITSTDADLNWVENNLAPEWEVEYGLNGFTLGTGTRVLALVPSPLPVSGLTPETDYDFYVRSVCAVGDTSAWSSVSSFTTEKVPCFEPTNLTATNITTTGADLGWTENNAATEWQVEYGLGGFIQGTGTLVGTTSSNPLAVSGLADDTDYDFYVRSICGVADTSGWSAVGSFRTSAIVPCLAPAGLSVSDIGVDSALFNWTDLNGSSQWEIEYETAGFTLGTGVNQIVNAPSPFEITQLTADTEYDVYIRSICGAGDTSAWVDTTFRTDTVPPVGLREFNLSDGLSVYPNPSNGLFTLDIQLPGQERLSLILRDVRGQLIHTEGVTVNGVYRDNLDFTGLAKGVYYLQVQSERESIIKKLVIQ